MKLASADGYQYIWIDTLCIDKSSSAELSEAINSMFEYYSNAEVCYIHLSDIDSADLSTLAKARWWSRGWTLQELLAPSSAVFYTREWRRIGARDEISHEISAITGIERQYLVSSSHDRDIVQSASVAKRMSWAAKCETRRSEDMAYSLLGLFSVNMPLLYGEGGERAFLRLQEEIMKSSNDHTIFAWLHSSDEPHGLLASSPSAFEHTGQYQPYTDMGCRKPYAMTNRGLQVSLCLTKLGKGRWLAALDCPPTPDTASGFLALVLRSIVETDSGNEFRRCMRVQCSKLTSITHRGEAPQMLYVPQVLPRTASVEMDQYLVFHLTKLSPGFAFWSAQYHHDPATYFTEQDAADSPVGSAPVAIFPMVAKRGAISAVLVIDCQPDTTAVSVILGCSADLDVAWEARERRMRPQNNEDDTFTRPFDPRQPGTWMSLNHYRVKVDIKKTVEGDKTMCNVDIEIHARSRRGTKAGVPTDESLLERENYRRRMVRMLVKK
ncbi:hypothetical protein CKM354_000801400 [Cercospora kikuchii]|uniref:Heterokaryon incompatibility domain-containing protein n=2 Tax=Cercospora kikuchii TaxID=84275 RepID=A0A9P3CNV3_9PEZI|nr:uncharacterized protein CKM354_000801400 [Cercospora kikuchii]GIZ44827.1 hypothetical protein CKM354_000801400 [Cercospora kikuchii]